MGGSKCVKRAKKILDSSAAGSLGWVPQNRDLNGGYTLIIAEKRYAADVYATALCTWNEGHITFNPENDHPETTDFYEGNGYLISWCLGHLFELFYPEDYNTKYKKWDVHDLPIIPNEWKYKIKDDYKEKEDSKHRFDVLKNLMSRDDVTDILCATDAGREGELIFREVYQQSGCKRPFQRTWLSSMETTSIRKVFENPDPSFRYYSFYKSARCRQLADWIVGMNATRYFTKQYGDNKETLNVGRVVTPTMAMIVEREKEIKDFVPKTYYTVNLNIDGITFESRPFEDEAIQVEQNCRESISVSEYGKF